MTEEKETKKKKISPYKDTKKEFQTVPCEHHNGLYKIKLGGGGQIPKALGGRYTSREEAQKDIGLYEVLTNKREK